MRIRQAGGERAESSQAEGTASGNGLACSWNMKVHDAGADEVQEKQEETQGPRSAGLRMGKGRLGYFKSK